MLIKHYVESQQFHVIYSRIPFQGLMMEGIRLNFLFIYELRKFILYINVPKGFFFVKNIIIYANNILNHNLFKKKLEKSMYKSVVII